MGAGSMSHQARFCAEPGASPHVFDTSSEPLELLREDVKLTSVIQNAAGITGSRSERAVRSRETEKRVGGSFTFNPSPNDFDQWLVRAMGGAGPALAETLPSFGLLFDRVAGTFAYKDCKVSRLILRGSAGQLVECTVEVIGKSLEKDVAFPTLTLGSAADDAPYVFSDLTLSLAGVAREAFSFVLTIDNRGSARMVNSLTATDVQTLGRVITLQTENPFTSDEDDLDGLSPSGIAAVLTLTNGTLSTTFTMPALQIPQDNPTVPGRETEVRIGLNGVARRTAGSAELTVTHDSTP